MPAGFFSLQFHQLSTAIIFFVSFLFSWISFLFTLSIIIWLSNSNFFLNTWTLWTIKFKKHSHWMRQVFGKKYWRNKAVSAVLKLGTFNSTIAWARDLNFLIKFLWPNWTITFESKTKGFLTIFWLHS